MRGWSAVRTFVTNETKRYVHAKDWHIAERVAFATLTQSPHRTVNGVWVVSFECSSLTLTFLLGDHAANSVAAV